MVAFKVQVVLCKNRTEPDNRGTRGDTFNVRDRITIIGSKRSVLVQANGGEFGLPRVCVNAAAMDSDSLNLSVLYPSSSVFDFTIPGCTNLDIPRIWLVHPAKVDSYSIACTRLRCTLTFLV